MRMMEGVVILAQESRFQMVDDNGVAHLFLLSHGASTEPSDLNGLQGQQARVRVTFADAANLKARVAHRVELCDPPARTRAG